MLSQKDLKQISLIGITEEQVEHQLDDIKKGFPFLKIESAASVGKGIMSPSENEMNDMLRGFKIRFTNAQINDILIF